MSSVKGRRARLYTVVGHHPPVGSKQEALGNSAPSGGASDIASRLYPTGPFWGEGSTRGTKREEEMGKRYKIRDSWGREIGEAEEIGDPTGELAGCLVVLTLLLLVTALAALVRFILLPLMSLMARGLQRLWASPTGRVWLIISLTALGMVVVLMFIPTPLGPAWTVLIHWSETLRCALGGICAVSPGAAWLALIEVVGLTLVVSLVLWQIGRWGGLWAAPVRATSRPSVRMGGRLSIQSRRPKTLSQRSRYAPRWQRPTPGKRVGRPRSRSEGEGL